MNKTLANGERFDHPPNQLIDEVYLQANFDNARRALKEAEHRVAYFHGEISSLGKQDGLPSSYQAIYQQLASMMKDLEGSIKSTRHKCLALKLEHLHSVEPRESNVDDDALVCAANKVTTAINQVEIDLINEVNQVQETWVTKCTSPKIDWAMPFEYKFTVLLNPGADRSFYNTCAEGDEPLRIDLGFFIPDQKKEGMNWNIFEFQKGHPLSTDHHGYLVRHILDRSPLCWELLPYIKEVEVAVEFNDVETAWLNPCFENKDDGL